MVTVKEKCSNEPECRPAREKFEECQKRITEKPNGEENCEEELLDFLEVLDKCVNYLFFISTVSPLLLAPDPMRKKIISECFCSFPGQISNSDMVSKALKRG
jgi:hypothetical protein